MSFSAPPPHGPVIRRTRASSRLLLTLLAATVVTALSPWFVPRWQAWHDRGRLAEDLTSEDGGVRLAALNHLVRDAGDDDALVALAAEVCRKADHENLVQLLNALRFAGRLDEPAVLATAGRRLVEDDPASAAAIWRLLEHAGVVPHPSLAASMRRHLSTASPDEAFLRHAAWIEEAEGWTTALVPASIRRHRLWLLARSPDAARRVDALTRTAIDRDLEDETLLNIVEHGVADGDAVVRDAAITCLARIAHRNRGSDRGAATPFLRLLADATADAETVVAFRAWLQLGLLLRDGFPFEPPDIDPASLPPAVALAAVWATEQTDRPPNGTDRDDGFTGIRALARAERCAPGTSAWIEHQFSIVAARLEAGATVEDADLLDAWRLLLAWRELQRRCGATAIPAVVHRVAHLAARRDALSALRPILAHCDPVATLRRPPEAVSPRERLAAVEGAVGAALDFVPAADDPTLLKVLAVDMASNPDPRWLRRGLRTASPEIRQLACIVAARRFDTAVLDRLIDELLVDYDDDARRSGALLSGLTGQRTETLASRLVVEVERPMRIAIRLGLWMQGAEQEDHDGDFALDVQGPAHVLAGDLDPTTTALARMQRRAVATTASGPEASAALLLELFVLEQQERIDLLELLVRDRGWIALASRMPAETPGLHVWSDPQMLDFQLDRLVAWARLHAPPADMPAKW